MGPCLQMSTGLRFLRQIPSLFVVSEEKIPRHFKNCSAVLTNNTFTTSAMLRNCICVEAQERVNVLGPIIALCQGGSFSRSSRCPCLRISELIATKDLNRGVQRGELPLSSSFSASLSFAFALPTPRTSLHKPLSGLLPEDGSVRFSSPTPVRALYQSTSLRLWRNWSLNIFQQQSTPSSAADGTRSSPPA